MRQPILPKLAQNATLVTKEAHLKTAGITVQKKIKRVFQSSLFVFSTSAAPQLCASTADSIELMAIGDSGWVTKNRTKQLDDSQIFARLSGIERLRSNDVNFLNLETSVVKNCKKFLPKKFSFATDPSILEDFIKWGFNLFALANNHTVDCINPNPKDSIGQIFKNNSRKFGNIDYHGLAATNDELLKPSLLKIKNFKIGMVSIKSWRDPARPYLGNNSNHEKLFDALRGADVEFRILSIHGGVERNRIPNPEVVHLSRKFILKFNGDLVIGHHPHVISGLELFRKNDGKKAAIVYSLGNGLHNGINGYKGDGMVLKLSLNRLEGITNIKLYPLRSNSFKLAPIPPKRATYYASIIKSSSSMLPPIELKDSTNQKKLNHTIDYQKEYIPVINVRTD